jgi:hypothetical protein
MRRTYLLVIIFGLVACGGTTAKSPSAGGSSDSGGAATLAGGAGDGLGGTAGTGGTQDPGDQLLGCVGGPHVECLRHSDCRAGQACLCRPGTNESRCAPANCHVDADCADGECLETITGDCPASSTVVGMYCTNPADSCDGKSPANGVCGRDAACRYDLGAGAYTCHPLCAG